MRLTIVSILIILNTGFFANGQNLVPNSSFEEHTGCPNNPGNIWRATPWIGVYGSIDYYNECGNELFDIPVSWGGGGYAKTGEAYSGLLVFGEITSNNREYLGIQLNDTLVNGDRYIVTFFLSMADSNWYSVKNFGAYFSESQPPANLSYILSLEPQITYSDTVFIDDKKGWTKIEGSFIAQGGETFMTIGNFDNDSETDTLFVDSGAVPNPSFPYYWTNAYYFIDDVSLTLDTTVGINELEKLKFEIYPNPAKEKLTIETEQTKEEITLWVVDVTGRVVLTSPLAPLLQERGTNSFSIDVSGFASGVYLLQLVSENSVVNKKIVIQH